MLNLITYIIYISLFHVQYVVCFSGYSNEWLAEINATEYETKILASRYGFEYINKIGNDLYVLKHKYSPRSSRRREENVKKLILRENQVKFVEQQKWNKRVLRSIVVNDPYWPNMWYLNGKSTKDMGVASCWTKGYTGKGVTIGIVDDGVEKDHPDLKQNYNSMLSYDVLDRDKDPSPAPGDRHGTECAGIPLATANNTNCVVGVAFDSQLAGVRVLGQYFGQSASTSTGEHDALLAAGIDIYSNSWGVTDKTTFEGPSSIVKSAFIQGTKKGRNGLGSIYVWAAGNGGSDDNCNCDGYVNSIYTIAISSVSSTLQPPWYAEPCAAIMAGAFTSNVCTTSINKACVTSFTGTSAAAPMAAGIFALALQANPSLTWRDLQHLIVHTSDMTDLKYGRSFTNGAGRTVSDYFGFGLLKSDLLLDRAQQWETVSEQHICLCTPNRSFVKRQILQRNPNRTVSSYIYTNGCNNSKDEVQSLEHVEVDITYSYSLRGAIEFFLISPSGTRSQLLTRRNNDLKQFSKQVWTFMSVQFWDENPEGIWTLQMHLYEDYGKIGQLYDWSLRLYGTNVNIYKNDIKDYTTSVNKEDIGTTGISVTTETSFRTTNAEKNINECSSNPCKNGATCIDGNKQFICNCSNGWSGVNCEKDINECSSIPCQNGATCIDGHNNYSCNCFEGWSGVNCGKGAKLDISNQSCINFTHTKSCKNGSNCDGEKEIPSCKQNPQHEATASSKMNIIIAASLGGVSVFVIIIVTTICCIIVRRKMVHKAT